MTAVLGSPTCHRCGGRAYVKTAAGWICSTCDAAGAELAAGLAESADTRGEFAYELGDPKHPDYGSRW